MIKETIRYVLLLILLLLLQFLVFNNINFYGYINPYIYVMFIMVLPFSLKKWHLLLIGFATGLLVDMFMNTLGLHASATLVAAFLRPAILFRFTNRVDIPRFPAPGINAGLMWFIRYVFILVLVHHAMLFFMEAFTFNHVIFTLLRIIFSTLFTTLFVVILEATRTQRKK